MTSNKSPDRLDQVVAQARRAAPRNSASRVIANKR